MISIAARYSEKVGAFYSIGSYGKVVRAALKKTDEEFALKIINKEKIEKSGLEEQVLNEIQITESLDHPNIIKLLGYFEDMKSVYLILELSDQGKLKISKELVGREREALVAKVDLLTYRKSVFSVLKAVSYLHNLTPPIVHRDIKPENILTFKNDIKLSDFGTANYKDKLGKETMCGTPEYLSPEMINQQGHDEKLDIWSIGILTYELLEGQTPFTKNLKATSENEEFFQELSQKILVRFKV